MLVRSPASLGASFPLKCFRLQSVAVSFSTGKAADCFVEMFHIGSQTELQTVNARPLRELVGLTLVPPAKTRYMPDSFVSPPVKLTV